jgi:hypothetical protein
MLQFQTIHSHTPTQAAAAAAHAGRVAGAVQAAGKLATLNGRVAVLLPLRITPAPSRAAVKTALTRLAASHDTGMLGLACSNRGVYCSADASAVAVAEARDERDGGRCVVGAGPAHPAPGLRCGAAWYNLYFVRVGCGCTNALGPQQRNVAFKLRR